MASVPILLDFTLVQGSFKFEIHERFETQALALFGPSGAGKTTLLDSIAGLRHPAKGEICVSGRQFFASASQINMPPQHRHVGYVPQEVSLFPHLTVEHNVAYGAGRSADRSIERVLDILDLKPMLDRDVVDLSGGERQRVAIARALASGPELLLLDEPLAAVDAPFRKRILPYIKLVRDELSIPLIYVSHAEEEVRRITDWVIVLDRGQVVQSGPIANGL